MIDDEYYLQLGLWQEMNKFATLNFSSWCFYPQAPVSSSPSPSTPPLKFVGIIKIVPRGDIVIVN